MNMHFTRAIRRQLAAPLGRRSTPFASWGQIYSSSRTSQLQDSDFSNRADRSSKRAFSGTPFTARSVFGKAAPGSQNLRGRKSQYSYPPLLLVFGSFGFLLVIGAPLRTLEAEAPNNADDGDGKEEMKTFRLKEVKEHGPKSERPWVIRGNNVYDITEWVAGHPGGEVILRAAGGSVDPYVSHSPFLLNFDLIEYLIFWEL
jgi:Cytochrome b5-like Heme/Steroid binding domain